MIKGSNASKITKSIVRKSQLVDETTVRFWHNKQTFATQLTFSSKFKSSKRLFRKITLTARLMRCAGSQKRVLLEARVLILAGMEQAKRDRSNTALQLHGLGYHRRPASTCKRAVLNNAQTLRKFLEVKNSRTKNIFEVFELFL